MSDEVKAYEYTYILKDLTSVAEADDRNSIIAYAGINQKGGQDVYYIKCRGGVTYDPFDTGVGNTRKSNLWKLVKTNREAYSLYLSYLKTRRKVFKFQAERNI